VRVQVEVVVASAVPETGRSDAVVGLGCRPGYMLNKLGGSSVCVCVI